jgi:DNA mismatch endonuclease (patch repair protein)
VCGHKGGGVRRQCEGVAKVKCIDSTCSRCMDIVTKVERSERMRAVGRERTSIERLVAFRLRQMKFRCVFNDKKLPGTPAVVIPSRNTAIFLHGCLWHRHTCRKGRCIPKTRISFWVNKFRSNAARDARVARQLRRAGWHVLVVWKCKTRGGRL